MQLIARKLSISELRRLNQEQQQADREQPEQRRPPLNSTPFNKPADNKENEGGRRQKLPPMLPPTSKRKGKLEPLSSSMNTADVFKSDNAFELSFSDTQGKNALQKERQKGTFDVFGDNTDALDML